MALTTRTSSRELLVSADGPDGLVLECAEELRLQGKGHVSDFVEEQRAAAGLGEEPTSLALGAGERALLVSEQLRLEQGVGDRRAIDRHERPCRREPFQ